MVNGRKDVVSNVRYCGEAMHQLGVWATKTLQALHHLELRRVNVHGILILRIFGISTLLESLNG